MLFPSHPQVPAGSQQQDGLLGSYLALALCRVGLAVTVNVLTHHDIRHLPPPHRDWGVAEGTYRNLDIL